MRAWLGSLLEDENMRGVVFQLPDDVTDEEARLLLSIKLYEQRRLSLAKAVEVAGCSRQAFMEILAHHKIPVLSYPESELEADLKNA